jgi:drug/metabolite transporter (DMT)-like permease
MDTTYAIFMSICILNPAFQNVGMGFQKWAVDKVPIQTTKAGKWKWIGVWIIGLLFQAVVVVLTSYAMTIGNASTLGGFAGLGLIFIALFSYFVIKEEVLPKEIFGMVLIVIGTMVLGYYSHGAQSPDVNMAHDKLVMFFAGYFVCVGIGLVLLFKNLHSYGGAILGIIGGSMNGLGVIFNKVFMNTATALFHSGDGIGTILVKMLMNGWTYVMIIGGVGGMIVIQFGYKYGKAVQVVPGHAVMVVVVPVFASVILIGESVPVIGIPAVLIITIGTLITTLAAPGKHAH